MSERASKREDKEDNATKCDGDLDEMAGRDERFSSLHDEQASESEAKDWFSSVRSRCSSVRIGRGSAQFKYDERASKFSAVQFGRDHESKKYVYQQQYVQGKSRQPGKTKEDKAIKHGGDLNERAGREEGNEPDVVSRDLVGYEAEEDGSDMDDGGKDGGGGGDEDSGDMDQDLIGTPVNKAVRGTSSTSSTRHEQFKQYEAQVVRGSTRHEQYEQWEARAVRGTRDSSCQGLQGIMKLRTDF